ncbi:MAG: efflux RND transporter periplasmic adaptor subunit [Bryocella sp.]
MNTDDTGVQKIIGKMRNGRMNGWTVKRAVWVSPLLLVALIAVQIAGCKKAVDESAKTVAMVQAVKPTVGAITETISADALLAPVAEAAIVPKVTAQIRKFYVQRGSHVKVGQLLATLENSDLAAAAVDNTGAYEAAKGSYATATASTVPEEQTKARLDVTQAKATLDLNETILKSRKQLLAEGAIPGRDVDTAQATVVQSQAAYEIARQHLQSVQKTNTSASLQVAKGTLASARGKYLGAEAQLSYTSVRSPISGVVTDRTLFAGETPAAGSPLLTIMDTSSMIAKLHIAQVQAQQLQVGSAATFTVPGMSATVDAKISLISPALDPGSTTVEVWLKAANPDGKMKAGTPVHVELKGRTIPSALLVPNEAMQRSSEGGGKVVMVITPDGKVQRRNVTVGIANHESTQILSGLSPNEMVITEGGYGLDDGTSVKIGAAESKDNAADAAQGGK